MKLMDRTLKFPLDLLMSFLILLKVSVRTTPSIIQNYDMDECWFNNYLFTIILIPLGFLNLSCTTFKYLYFQELY